MRGATGQKGQKGARGPIGPKGDLGLKGDIGPIGEQGAEGQLGPQGVLGVTGVSAATARVSDSSHVVAAGDRHQRHQGRTMECFHRDKNVFFRELWGTKVTPVLEVQLVTKVHVSHMTHRRTPMHSAAFQREVKASWASKATWASK